MRLSRRRYLLLYLSLLSVLGWSQEKFPCGSVVVGATDSRGRSVSGLKTSDFRISSRGKNLAVASSEYRQNPAGKVVVLLDVSGSMSGPNKWKIAHAMALAFVSWAPPQEKISLFAFADSIQRRFPASEGRKPILDWLKSPEVSSGQMLKGRTALLQTISGAITELSPVEPGDSIYIISDGFYNGSGPSSGLIERELLNSGIRVFAFLLTDKYSSSLEAERSSWDLERMIEQTGGVLSKVRTDVGLNDTTVAKMQDTTLNLLNRMSNFYLLRIDGVEPSPTPKAWRLEAVDAQGRNRRDITLSYPHRPSNCTQQSAQETQ